MTSDEVALVPVRIYRRRDRLTVAAALPGAEPEDIVVEVTTRGTLLISGRMRGASVEDEEMLLDEWASGPYHREVPLSFAVDGGLANMTYRNGVLVVVLPIADSFQAATLRMTTIAPAYGEQVGSHGSSVKPVTSEEHVRGGHDQGGPDPAT